MKSTARTVMKKIVSWTLVTSMGLGMVAVPNEWNSVEAEAATTDLSAAEGGYDYGRAWQQTLMFYEFQKSGLISQDDPSCNRNNWKGDCEWNDGKEIDTEPLYRTDDPANPSKTKTWTAEDGAYWDPEEDGTLDLTGGWHDAGDHVKFNLPMAYASGMLAWSYLEYKDTYEKTGQDKYALNEIRWVNDYLMKCHAKENVYFYQVGDGDVDHQFWGGPELIDEPGVREIQMPKITRPCYWVNNTAKHGGSAVCADSAASLAAASIIYKDTDPEYSAKCLEHARGLYQMALDAQSDVGYMEHGQGYYSSTHFEDELSWGGAWLYKATGEREYLDTALSYDHKWGGTEMEGDLRGHVWTQCWDDVRYGAMLLMAELDDGDKGLECRTGIEYNLDYWSTGVREDDGSAEGRPARGKYTPRGLVMINDWGSVRYAGAEAAMAMFYCNWKDADPERVKSYKEFAKAQADYILGSTGRNFIVGYNDASPRNPHHRTADGAWKNSPLKCPTVSRHTLVGAIVGGPDGGENYDDNRNNYCTNEVANDYNAGPMCLMAAMYQEYGGTIDPNMNAYEEVGEEYYMDGCNCNQGKDNDGRSFCEVKLRVENHTGWPARPSKGLKFRYFVNIKDAKYVKDPEVYPNDTDSATKDDQPSRIGTSVKAEDFEVISYYTQRKSLITNLIPWNEEEGIYYVEVALGWDEKQMAEYEKEGIPYQKVGEADSYMYPGGDVECRADMQLLVRSPMGSEWDYSKNFSYVEIKDTKVDERKKIQNIPLYEDDRLVGGIEPAKTGPVDLTIPDVAVDDISVGEADSDGTVLQSINFNLGIGETLNPSENVIINPSNATDKTLTWQSMNTNVATVDADGTITGVGKGSTSIIVWANGGGKPANMVVNVDGGVEDLYSAKVLGTDITWTPPEIKVGPKVTNGESVRPTPSVSVSVPGRPSSNPAIPSSETSKPSGSSNKPSSDPATSGEETSKPSGETSQPSGQASQPGEETSKPNGETSQPSAAVSKPSGAASQPGGEVSKPDGTVSQPSGEAGKPSGAASQPNGEVSKPSGAASQPNGEVSKPDGTASQPGGETSKPSGATSQPGGETSKPSGTVSQPSGEVSKPSGAVSQPSGGQPNITINLPASINLIEGEQQKLIPEVKGASEADVKWSVEDDKVATVSAMGIVTAVSEGQTKVIATLGTETASCIVNVAKEAETPVSVKVVNIREDNVTLEPGQSYTLDVSIEPNNLKAEDKALIWKCEPEGIATVDANGRVTAVSEGQAIVTATSAKDATKKDICKITVSKKKGDIDDSDDVVVTGFDVTPTSEELDKKLEVGKTVQLTPVFTPGNASNKGVTYTSITANASVDESGMVTARAPGKAIIVIVASDARTKKFVIQREFEILESSNTTKVESVTMNQKTYQMSLGDSITKEKLGATVNPKEADQALEWSSDNENVVYISEQNKIWAVGVGTATLTVTSAADPSKKATCKITVTDGDTNKPSIRTSSATITMTAGTSKKLKTTITPSNATVTYKSNNDKIVSLSNKKKTGVTLKAKKAGKVTISIQAKSKSTVTKKITVTVKPAKVTGLKKATVSSRTIKLSWKKQTGVTGYAVYRYDTKSKKYKLYKKTNKNTLVISNMNRKTTYKFKVKAYKTISGKAQYGAYSSVLTVRTK